MSWAPKLLILAGFCLLAACSGARSAEMPPQTLLLIDCSPADAELWLDGHWVPPLAAVATAASFEVEGSADGVSYRIAEGPRRLELRRAGYYPHRRDLKVSAQRSYRLEVDLVRVLE